MLLGAALVLGGCASVQPPEAAVGVPPLLRDAAADGIDDLRGAYRAALCRRLPLGDPTWKAGAAACERVLPATDDEPAATALPATDAVGLAARYRVLLAAGLFADCLGTPTHPMGDIQEALDAAGFSPERLPLAGRGSAASNAERVAARIAALEDDGRRLIVLAYSKGLIDVLEMAARHPEIAPRIAAVISLAGAARGSQLADAHIDAYRRWIAGLPLPGCAPGSGEELLDLSPPRRATWWAQHRDALGFPIYVLVAAPSPQRISPALQPTYRALARTDPRNDGQLLWLDQIAPGSRLLGFVDADHWAIANPLSRSLPLLAFLFIDDVPRAELVAAAIEVVDATLPTRVTR